MQRISHTPVPRLRRIAALVAVALLAHAPAALAQGEDEPAQEQIEQPTPELTGQEPAEPPAQELIEQPPALIGQPAPELAGEELLQTQPPPPPPPPPLGPPREHDRHVYMTTDMRFSRAPDHTLMFEAGANVGKAIRRNVALSIELSGSSAPLLGGNRGAVSVLPSAEYFHFHGPLQAYGRLGLGTQYRGGAQLDSTKALGVFAAVGSRLRFGRCRGNGPHRRGLTGCFVAGLEIRLHHATLDGWLMYPAVLPQGASILSTGFSMGFEL